MKEIKEVDRRFVAYSLNKVIESWGALLLISASYT